MNGLTIRAAVQFVDVALVDGGRLIYDVKHEGRSMTAAYGPFRPELLRQLYPSWDGGDEISLLKGVLLGSFSVLKRDKGGPGGWIAIPNYSGTDASRIAGATCELWTQVQGKLLRLAVWPHTAQASLLCRVYSPQTDDTARDVPLHWDKSEGNFHFQTEPQLDVGERLLIRAKSSGFLIVRPCDFLVEIKSKGFE